MIYFCRFRSW